MSGKEFVFRRLDFTPWTSRYSKIGGKTTAFRVKSISEKGLWPIIEWDHDEGRALCRAIDGPNISNLVEAIVSAKRQMSGSSGGAFVINEFGQVIVPSSAGDGIRLLVGEVEGQLLFDNPITQQVIDLSDDSGLKLGDPWDKPYIGVKHRLNMGSSIYFWHGSNSEYPPCQDQELVTKLRSVRRTGPVSFIVNPYGIVLTKVPVGDYRPDDEDQWQPVYVGMINKTKWFAKEE